MKVKAGEGARAPSGEDRASVKESYEKLINCNSDDDRNHDSSWPNLSAGRHRNCAARISRQSQWTTDKKERRNRRIEHHRPTIQKLFDRVRGDVEKLQAENPGRPIPVDLVTSSASGLDPHISPAAAEFQVARVAAARNLALDRVRALVAQATEDR